MSRAMLNDEELARLGVDPAPNRTPQELDHLYRHLGELGLPEGMSHLVAAAIERLQNDPETRLRAELGNKAGIAYSEALARWRTADDLAMELALASVRSAERWEQCPQCGTRPDDWTVWIDRSADGLPPLLREKEEPPFTFELWDCYACDRLASLNEGVSEADRARGQRWVIKPRELNTPSQPRF